MNDYYSIATFPKINYALEACRLLGLVEIIEPVKEKTRIEMAIDKECAKARQRMDNENRERLIIS